MGYTILGFAGGLGTILVYALTLWWGHWSESHRKS